MIRLLHRAALLLERLLQPLTGRKRRRASQRVLEPYIGYATPDHVILRGRILATLSKSRSPGKRRLANLRNMAALFMTDELAEVDVSHGLAHARSDEEGYFQLLVAHGGSSGWQDFDVEISDGGGTFTCTALVPARTADFMVISDIDDTVMQTGAYSLLRNLWTTFTGSAATRHIFPDAVALLKKLSAQGRNPVYYVSSSPWNLHRFLEDVLWPAGLPRGPMFLRDLGLNETQFITSGHGSHKGRNIDLLMAANPDLPVVLMGDTGQHDAEIYRDAVQRHPGRVRAVLLREARRDKREIEAVRELEAGGVFTAVAPQFDAESAAVKHLYTRERRGEGAGAGE